VKEAGWFLLGALVATAIVARLELGASSSSCCQRVNAGARDKIAGYTGPFSGLVSGFLDATGLTNTFSGLLDTLGVPTGQ
jgi:hypothetical protein